MKLATLVSFGLLGNAIAVKKYLFRTCDENPFCNRNRHYAQESLKSGFETPYSLDPSSLEISGSEIKGNLLKNIPSGQVNLDFLVEFKENDLVHLVIDEKPEDRKKVIGQYKQLAVERFDPAKYMLDYSNFPKAVKCSVNNDGKKLVATFPDETRVEISLSPFELKYYKGDKPLIVLNGEKLLNFEQLRTKESDESNRNTWESDFGSWEDTHDGKTDKKIRGPESVALDVFFPGSKHVYGIPEHADSMNLRTTKNQGDPYRLFNVDIFEYETNSVFPMYGSIPFMISQQKDYTAGVFWLNSADSYIDIDRNKQGTLSHWMSETGKINLFLYVGESPKDVLKTYGRLTGNAELPQLFATGYHQCRWNYNSQDDVLEVNEKFDDNDIPYDVIWLDVEYTINKKYFTWNRDAFPSPEDMNAELDKDGRKLVTIIDPHIKVESGYPIYDELTKQDITVKNGDAESHFEGHCWPGNSVYIDTFNPKSWDYLKTQYAKGGPLDKSSDNLHIWNDMNEPSVFSGPETSAFKDLIHYGGWQHRDVHNLYGQTYVNATFNAMDSRYNHKQRPFILTRSYFSGSQKLAAMWTGDNMAKWEYLHQSIPMILTSGLSGMPFAGADVGGFFGNPDSDLLARWYQAGAFYPFFRGHAHIDSRRREPYTVPEPYLSVIKSALALRYQLLPTFYTAFYQSSQDLSPVLRPIFYEAPDNDVAYPIDNEFFLGNSILVKPVTEKDAKDELLYLPDDQYYYNYWTHERVQGPKDVLIPVDINTIPMFARGGTIHVRRDRPRRSAELMRNDPYTLVVAVGKDGKATGEIYADDGVSYDYAKGDYVTSVFSFDGSSISGTVTHPGKGPFSKIPVERIIVLGSVTPSKAELDGKPLGLIPIENGYIIRNPRVPIGTNWRIEFESA